MYVNFNFENYFYFLLLFSLFLYNGITRKTALIKKNKENELTAQY